MNKKEKSPTRIKSDLNYKSATINTKKSKHVDGTAKKVIKEQRVKENMNNETKRDK